LANFTVSAMGQRQKEKGQQNSAKPTKGTGKNELNKGKPKWSRFGHNDSNRKKKGKGQRREIVSIGTQLAKKKPIWSGLKRKKLWRERMGPLPLGKVILKEKEKARERGGKKE